MIWSISGFRHAHKGEVVAVGLRSRLDPCSFSYIKLLPCFLVFSPNIGIGPHHVKDPDHVHPWMLSMEGMFSFALVLF